MHGVRNSATLGTHVVQPAMPGDVPPAQSRAETLPNPDRRHWWPRPHPTVAHSRLPCRHDPCRDGGDRRTLGGRLDTPRWLDTPPVQAACRIVLWGSARVRHRNPGRQRMTAGDKAGDRELSFIAVLVLATAV